MARRLLTTLLALALAAPLAAPLAAHAAPLVCTGTTPPADAAAGLAHAARNPLAILLARRLGPATACTATTDDTAHTLTLAYPQGGQLVTTSDDTIEAASVTATLPAAVALTQPDALAALRATETEQAGAQGCGIAWSPLAHPMPPSADRTAQNRTGPSCKAHLHTQGHAVTTLDFSMAS